VLSGRVDRSSPVPVWAQVVQDIRRRIDAGVLVSGQRLPSETELAAEFSVSRITIRQALGHLSADGYVDRRQGTGTFVSARTTPVQHDLSLNVPWRIRLRDEGHKAISEPLVSAVERAVPADFGEGFAVAGEVVYLKRLQRVDTQPIGITESWLPARLVPGLAEEPLIDGSLSLTLKERYGIVAAEVDNSLETVLATAADAQLLDAYVDVPLFVVTAVSRLADGDLLEVSRTSWVGSRVRFRFLHKIG
jgi:GntR family transcriptional regulator